MIKLHLVKMNLQLQNIKLNLEMIKSNLEKIKLHLLKTGLGICSLVFCVNCLFVDKNKQIAFSLF